MTSLLSKRITTLPVATAVALALQPCGPSWAADLSAHDLANASLEELMNIQVTSVSKKPEKLSQTDASVFVITAEDIRRSGAMNIPDLLRMVPGMDVARIDANAWAISVHGFNSRYAQNLLVMIDGRTVYTPGFSGVYWDQQDVPLEDIDRIEVIRGPGGTIWGANAVNGVINIITKSASDTKGGLVTLGTGNEESVETLAQYGGKAGSNGHYRVFGRYFKVESSPGANGIEGFDGWHGTHGGFRSDWDLSTRDSVTLQGDLFGSSEGQTITTLFADRLPDIYTLNDKVKVATGNVLGRWKHEFANGSETTVQAYYDRFRRFDQALDIANTGDLDFEYHFHVGTRNDIVTGTGYRITDHSYTQGYEISFGSGHRMDTLVSGFLQDQISLTRSLSLTLGSKFEHNDYTGFEFEPSAQIAYTPTSRHTLWASAARAIRQPSWLDDEVNLDAAAVPVPGAGFGVVTLFGNPASPAEDMRDFEIGYRTRLRRSVSLDISGFTSFFRNVPTYQSGAPYFTADPAPPHLVFPSYGASQGRAHDYGVDFSANWSVTNWWRLSPGFSFLQMNMWMTPSAAPITPNFVSGDNPKHQAQLRSFVNLTRRLEWDTSAYFVGHLGIGLLGTPPVPAYTRLDTRLGWKAGENVDLSLTGQNLLTPRRTEFLTGYQVNPTQVERSIVGKITWRF